MILFLRRVKKKKKLNERIVFEKRKKATIFCSFYKAFTWETNLGVTLLGDLFYGKKEKKAHKM